MIQYKTVIALLLVAMSAHAQYKMEEGPKASKPYNQWSFELANKSKDIITITAYHQHGSQKNAIIQYGHTIQPKDKLRIAHLKNKRWDTILNLSYKKNNKTKNITITIPAAGQDKQILLKFENDLVGPQLGTFAGAGGKTSSGIPIVNNVKESEITGNDQEIILEKVVDSLFD